MKPDIMSDEPEEQAMLLLMTHLKNLCHRRWSNLEPEDRLSEVVLFTLCAIRSLSINSGHFIPDLNATLSLYMDEQNRKTPSRFYGCDQSLDGQMATSNGDDSWNLYAILSGSEIDESSIMVHSFLNSLPDWQKNLLRDLQEQGLPKSAAALKYGMSVYTLDKILMKLWADYQSGNWSDK